MLSSINTAAKTCKSGEHGLQVHISMTRLYLLVYEFYSFFFLIMVSFSEHYLWLCRRGDFNSYPPANVHDHINSGDGYKHRGVYSVKFTPARG